MPVTLADLEAQTKKNDAELANLRRWKEQQERLPVNRKGYLGDGPYATTGPVGENSRRFSLANWMVNGLRNLNPERAKPEMDAMRRLQKAINDTGSRIAQAPGNAFWLPLSWSMLGDDVNSTEDAKYCKAMMSSEPLSYDADEANWLASRGIVRRKSATAGQLAYTDNYGGTLVAPPVQGEVIPMIRPNTAFLTAGAQTVGLPPQGRYVRPRITSVTIAEALGETQSTPSSRVSTDQMVLQAKKIAGAVFISEEATNFTSGTIDTIAQNDLAMSLGLKIDAYAFYGQGGPEIPAGLTSAVYDGAVINVATDYPNMAGIGTNGNDLLPQLGDRIPTLIEERSFGLEGDASGSGAWVMRPAALSRARSYRASAVTAGDEQGPYVDILRKFTENASQDQWSGRKVIKTTNLKNNLTKGSATDLSDAFYGLWSYGVLGAYGAIQFTTGNDGNTFLNGQHILRGVMWGDVGFLYPTAFAWYTKVLGANGLLAS